MSPTMNTETLVEKSFPRVSGDEPLYSGYRYPVNVFSPRERG